MSTPDPSSATLPLSRIVKGDNPRRYFDRRKHDDLVASIRIRGILQPILLRPAPGSDDSYAIVAGERRYRAALEALGPDGEVPAIIRNMTDQEALEAAIDENDNRDDASETEQADAAVRVLAACHNDRAEAARRLGWSRAKLDRRLALAELSDAVKLALDERRIKVGHAELLAAIPGDKQDKALETILGSGLDVSKTRDLLMRVTQNLGAACFDKSECTTCPFNSAAQRTLFETHVDDGHCTNPGCFELKTEAWEAARRTLGAALQDTRNPPVYWMDLGNRASDGQYLIGCPRRGTGRDDNRLPTVLDAFPELADESLAEDDAPSCSVAEALERQSLFVNRVLASHALALLFDLLGRGSIGHAGAFLNIASGQAVPIPLPRAD